MNKEIHTLDEHVEYIIIQNEKTGEVIAKITDNEVENEFPIIVRIKYK
jgi:hypothetical protein